MLWSLPAATLDITPRIAGQVMPTAMNSRADFLPATPSIKQLSDSLRLNVKGKPPSALADFRLRLRIFEQIRYWL